MSLLYKLFLSFVLGAAIGLERESYEFRTDKSARSGVGSLGVRTFSLITTLGAVAGLFYVTYFPIFLLISITFMALLLIYYAFESFYNKDQGITTELAIVFSYLAGVFVAMEILPVQLIIAMVVVLIAVMSMKMQVKSFIAGLKGSELKAFVSYAIIALVILPFLPDRSFSLESIPNLRTFAVSLGLRADSLFSLPLFNPFNIWRVVVLITGVDILGYILEKTIGQKKGWLFTSLAGGFISSTSTTISLAIRSKLSKSVNKLTAAAIFANFSSFIQHAVVLAVTNAIFFTRTSIYLAAIMISSFMLGFWFLRKSEKSADDLKDTKQQLKEDKIFALGPALKFALIFFAVTVVTKISLQVFGQSGFIISSAIAAVTGLDAVSINVSQLAGKTISFFTALLTLILANAINLGAKTTYAYLQGNRRFAKNFGISMAVIVLASLIGLVMVI